MESAEEMTGAAPDGLRPSDLHFDLPTSLIAQEPAATRTAARLLAWRRAAGDMVQAEVSDLPRFMRAGDLLVFNDTQVIPARIYGRSASGAAVELLLVRPAGEGHRARLIRRDRDREVWQCLGRPARRLAPGAELRLPDGTGARVVSTPAPGRFEIEFDADDVWALLGACGETPLPPYIKRPDGPLPLDHERYQTVYAARPGAVAAPTAGLHFDADLLDRLRRHDVRLAYLTLHVGPGTFLPVRGESLSGHVMEPEWCDIPDDTAAAVNRAHRDGRRIVAVGTTTTRALESAADDAGAVRAGTGWADRFIVPGYRFRVVDCLFTNFHLPGSTLLALVCAFAGREPTLAVYAEAVRRRYRFYSYGDAMLVQ